LSILKFCFNLHPDYFYALFVFPLKLHSNSA
jgi:hypothetical protein